MNRQHVDRHREMQIQKDKHTEVLPHREAGRSPSQCIDEKKFTYFPQNTNQERQVEASTYRES